MPKHIPASTHNYLQKNLNETEGRFIWLKKYKSQCHRLVLKLLRGFERVQDYQSKLSYTQLHMISPYLYVDKSYCCMITPCLPLVQWKTHAMRKSITGFNGHSSILQSLPHFRFSFFYSSGMLKFTDSFAR